MRIEPDTHMLESLRAERPNYVILIGEGVDNAFDADARNIRIAIDEDAITLKDDGIGVTKDRILSIAKIGSHAGMTTTALGRFGVGIKFQALSAGDILEMVSVSKDGRARLIINWGQIIRQGTWEIDDPAWTTALPSVPTGTSVSIKSLRGKPVTPSQLKNIRDGLAERFHPALTEGRTISLNGEPVAAAPDPQITDVVEHQLSFSNGKSARVRGGVLVDARSKMRLVHVSYRHRVIMPRVGFGCGDVTGPMFARVDLSGPWKLSKFKDDIVDDERDDLDSAVFEALKPVLEKCRTKNMSAVIDDMTRRLNEMLPPELIPVRPDRKKDAAAKQQQDRKSKIRGIASGAPESATGPARAPRTPKDHLLICFDEPLSDQYGYGKFDGTARPNRVVLAKDNPRIAGLINHRDREESLRTLMDFALSIYVHEKWPNQLPLGDYGLMLWKLAAKQDLNEAAA